MPEIYDVYFDGDESEISDISFAVVLMWIEFALGKRALNGRRIQHPTGRYASSITRIRTGPNRIAVIADEKIAPEAEFIEHGHSPYDMKKLFGGRTFLLHRGQVGDYGSAGFGTPIVNSTPTAIRKNIWAIPRSEGATGFKTVPESASDSSKKAKKRFASSWIIPHMAAYAPAAYLADAIRNGSINIKNI